MHTDKYVVALLNGDKWKYCVAARQEDAVNIAQRFSLLLRILYSDYFEVENGKF